MSDQPPPASGQRLPWSALPPRLLAALEGWLGASVVSATTQPGGFSPAVAARVRAPDDRRVFVKAVGPEPNEDSPEIYRREGRVAAALPPAAPAPRLLWSYDEGDGGWVMLVFEDVEGWNPAHPWRPAELDRVLDTLAVLSEVLTPSPIRLGSASEKFTTRICGWGHLREEQTGRLDDWSARHLDALAALEKEAVEAAVGEHSPRRLESQPCAPSRLPRAW